MKVPLTERCRGFERSRVMRSLPWWTIMRIVNNLKYTTRLTHIIHAYTHTHTDTHTSTRTPTSLRTYTIINILNIISFNVLCDVFFCFFFFFLLSLFVCISTVFFSVDFWCTAYTVRFHGLHFIQLNIDAIVSTKLLYSCYTIHIFTTRIYTRYARVKSYKNRK